ncbi:uncharacterized protein DNG_06259 [Cephalotrichum gorgonifer]|uniref:Uncharacterized protein n=1 Tax=Cephalotrichum gorgonifer TaxID=2041049 RepID=A0AAE8MZA9_9PEZI|nr:uncharacterized protein DNG_06259 [Cephalotrichum gorgonifer]
MDPAGPNPSARRTPGLPGMVFATGKTVAVVGLRKLVVTYSLHAEEEITIQYRSEFGRLHTPIIYAIVASRLPSFSNTCLITEHDRYVERERILDSGRPLANIEASLFVGTPPPLPGTSDNPQWGLPIYRTDYRPGTSAVFSQLQARLHSAALYSLNDIYERPDLISNMDFPVIGNTTSLDCVYTKVTRELFNRWAERRGVPRRPARDLPKYPLNSDGTSTYWGCYDAARYRFCLVADRRFLDSMWEEDRDQFIAVLWKDWKPLWHPDVHRIYSYEDLTCELDPIEGNPDDDIGWFYRPLTVLVGYYDKLCTDGIWGWTPEIPGVRPPRVVETYGGDYDAEVWRGDEIEGHHRREVSTDVE